METTEHEPEEQLSEQDSYLLLQNLMRQRKALFSTKMTLTEAVKTIEIQIENAKAKKDVEGTPANPQWFWKANQAFYLKSRQLKRLNQEIMTLEERIAPLKKRHRRRQEESRERRFISLCHEKLPKPVWDRLWELVEEEFPQT